MSEYKGDKDTTLYIWKSLDKDKRLHVTPFLSIILASQDGHFTSKTEALFGCFNELVSGAATSDNDCRGMRMLAREARKEPWWPNTHARFVGVLKAVQPVLFSRFGIRLIWGTTKKGEPTVTVSWVGGNDFAETLWRDWCDAINVGEVPSALVEESDMGQQLTYEIGKLNLGRRVKVWTQYGSGSRKQHGMSAMLKEAHPKYAIVILDNHDNKPEQCSWDCVRDWTSHNTTALVLPKYEPAPTPAPAPQPKAAALNGTHKTGVRALPMPAPTTVPVPAPAPAPAPAPQQQPQQLQPQSEWSDLPARIEAALSDIDAAEELVDSALEQLQKAKAEHAEAVARLDQLRKPYADMMERMNIALAGTSAARR